MLKKNPLAEVFGHPTDDQSADAKRCRTRRLCPFNNKVPNCTKAKAKDPLGVCSIYENEEIAITCPIRFRQGWRILEDAADFFFTRGTKWTSLMEVRLKDNNEQSAGNIDLVLVAYDDKERITDFGALEVQAVYISGNVREPFAKYMENPSKPFDWPAGADYPRPDYLSSSRKRLLPQLLYKGGILHKWGKKQAVALQSGFFATLPPLPEVVPRDAEIAWLLYDIRRARAGDGFKIVMNRIVYTGFHPALNTITTAEAGSEKEFRDYLQHKLDEHLEDNNPPDAPTLTDLELT